MTTKVVLFDTQYASSVETEMYLTPDNTVTTVDKMSAMNTDGTNREIIARLVPPEGTPTGTEFIVDRKTISAGQTYLFPAIVGHILAAGGSITLQADADGVIVVRGSGREDPDES